MSIAVSAVIRTPVGLRVLQACLGSCALLAAGPLSRLWPLEHVPGLDGAYALGWPAAVLSACGGLFLLALSCRRTKPQTLDISPVGQIRLAVYLEHGAGLDDRGGIAGQERGQARSVQYLLPASTLWPGWLLLRLGNEEGQVVSVLVRRGARSCPAFRTLAVACRAIAARGREK
ncbi:MULTISPECIES: hypothetical protein [unclassified Janthinobacterium]|uniref:hypothetical protein n=1 Tax=unclassified Janthinobacterium TaxID=2610881 RepID=UPI00160C9937|nr:MULTISPECIES: hypothetical protein [unclassified Janthinobacterium]MBB5366874.1 hypothetical protein [Janthinobacterium sp. K2C7]MBB5380648.1 hypothetical protein [Janthinobacterium sp. K2Li3]MBB5385256.1 hypothetical protein [Janthinobacterium sp. K2E3]